MALYKEKERNMSKEQFESNQKVFEEPRCPYCKKRMCGAMTGSEMCGADLYRKKESYTKEQIKAIKEDWGIEDFDKIMSPL